MRIMLIANHYRYEHAKNLTSYRKLDSRASTWNQSLINELMALNIELHIICFYPIYRPYIFKEKNTTFYYLPKIPFISSRTSLFTRLFVKMLSATIKPDIIHGIGSEHGYTFSAINNNKPSIITIHGYLNVISELDSKSYGISEKQINEESKSVKEANAIIAINHYMKNLLTINGANKGKITVIPNPVNSLYQSDCKDSSKTNDILMVGTFSKLKNYHKAIQVLALLREKYNLLPSLYIAGSPTNQSDNYYDEIINKINSLELTNIHLLGDITPNKLKKFYCNTKFFLHLSAFETDSMVVSEAMECGCVPIVNKVANLKHKVTDGLNGYHVDSNDIEKTTDIISRLLIKNYTDIHKTYTTNYTRHISTKEIANKTFTLYKSIHKKTSELIE